jgi:transcriptional regulator with XRE-family HTH domain
MWKRSCDDSSAMSGREAFGPNLRRARIQRGVSLEEIARRTNVSKTLWAAMERSDFSRWPNGIFARAYLRDYAKIIGVDPETTVDEFCRWFPHGDRRAEPQIRGQAEIVGHDLDWSDPVPAEVAEGDRRWSADKVEAAARVAASQPEHRASSVFDRLRRALSRA